MIEAFEPNVIGWREWVGLPELGIGRLKAKVDTGARSSALHAFDIEYQTQEKSTVVAFKIHPDQRDKGRVISAKAPLLDQRDVRNSGGQSQRRPVILTTVVVGVQRWAIELTLTNRDDMGFRMLLGRQAVRHRFCVDPGRSFLLSGRLSKLELGRTPLR